MIGREEKKKKNMNKEGWVIGVDSLMSMAVRLVGGDGYQANNYIQIGDEVLSWVDIFWS